MTQTQTGISQEITAQLPSAQAIPITNIKQLLSDMNIAIFQSQGPTGLVISGTPSPGQVPTATGPNAATWQTPPPPGTGGTGSNMKYKTAAYVAVAGDEVLADTSAGVWTLTLPPAPSQLDKIVIRDAKSTWTTNNLTVARNGNNITGIADNLVCDTTQTVTLIFIDTTTGWGVF